MKSFKRPDYFLLVISAALALLGILILASVSAAFSMEKFGHPGYLLNHQILYGLLPGLGLGLIAFFLPLEVLKKLAPWFLLGLLVSLGLLLSSKIGLRFLGASRWLNLGFVVFQPSEFLKLAIILYLGVWLTKEADSPKTTQKRIDRLAFSKPLLPFIVIIGFISLLLVLQPDVGTLGIVTLISFSMFFLAGTPVWQNFSILAAGLAALALLIRAAPYRLNRLLVFLNPGFDPMGKGYQISQSLIAIGSGGIFGLGLGLSRQKFGFLPQTIGDAIFPVFAEEAGFLGAMILILFFLLFLWQGFKVSLASKDRFSRLVASGISFWIGGQALINIGSMTGLLPLTGVPLPFVSYGGSHLVAELIGVGTLLNISKQTT